MGRVVNTDSVGKRRNQMMRTAAEMLRHLSQKQDIDDEAKDMLALLVYALRDIDEGVLEATRAWEKRNYWVKIEQFQQKWGWAGMMADQLERLILNEQWQDLPAMMVKLLPKFAEVKVTKFTRKDSEWFGRYEQLLRERDR
ncbi:MAG: hypothetical protein OHK0046_01060 [Anaerolineae bacterium]